MIEELDESNFDATMSGPKMVVVEFYTHTCVNCAANATVYEGLSRELSGYANFVRVNAQANQALARRFGVMGVPSFVFLCKGNRVGDIVGAVHETILRNQVRDFARHGGECAAKATPLAWGMDGYG
ncbi:MAG: thioredoxin family protein [Methanobacteriota archaeon]